MAQRYGAQHARAHMTLIAWLASLALCASLTAAQVLTVPRTGQQVPVPQTDQEALSLLDYDHPGLTATMRGLYHVYRAQGYGVLDALVKTLAAWEAHGTGRKEQPRVPRREPWY